MAMTVITMVTGRVVDWSLDVPRTATVGRVYDPEDEFLDSDDSGHLEDLPSNRSSPSNKDAEAEDGNQGDDGNLGDENVEADDQDGDRTTPKPELDEIPETVSEKEKGDSEEKG